jgi:RNA 2',3'-cyclic 3'-phosphodiesterase
MRTFIAIPLPGEIHQKLADLIQRLKEPGNHAVRWVTAENIHLTLKFLGEVAPEKAQDISHAMEEIAGQAHFFDIRIKHTGAFPNLKRPRVFWVGISQFDELKNLQEMLEKKMERLGFESENRPFSPHLTLGRVNESASRQELDRIVEKITRNQAIELGSVHVTEMQLFKSDLTPKGSIYSVLFTANLSKSEP